MLQKHLFPAPPPSSSWSTSSPTWGSRQQTRTERPTLQLECLHICLFFLLCIPGLCSFPNWGPEPQTNNKHIDSYRGLQGPCLEFFGRVICYYRQHDNSMSGFIEIWFTAWRPIKAVTRFLMGLLRILFMLMVLMMLIRKERSNLKDRFKENRENLPSKE